VFRIGRAGIGRVRWPRNPSDLEFAAMSHIARSVSIVLAGTLAACSGDHMQEDDAGLLAENIRSARLEVSRHQNAVSAASALTEVPAEMTRHDREMGNVMDMMDSRMSGMMSHCSGSGMGMMHDRMGGIDSEMRSYRDAMWDAPTLADAREVCAAHTRQVSGMLDDMHRSLGTVGCMGR
jgi:hypothetical protein